MFVSLMTTFCLHFEVELVFVAKEQLSVAWNLASDSEAEVRGFGV